MAWDAMHQTGRWRILPLAHVIRNKNKPLNRVRRIKGHVDAVERSLEGGAECSDILHTIAACRGAIDGLMAEVIEGHIRFHGRSRSSFDLGTRQGGTRVDRRDQDVDEISALN